MKRDKTFCRRSGVTANGPDRIDIVTAAGKGTMVMQPCLKEKG